MSKYLSGKTVRKCDTPAYTIDNQILKRFDERENIFGRMLYDRDAFFYRKSMYDRLPDILKTGKDGYSRIEFARTMGGWAVYDYFYGAFSWKVLKDSISVIDKPVLKRFTIDDPVSVTKKVRETAELYGADLVGVCEIDRRWVYSFDIEGNPITVPENYKYAIVLAIAMDLEEIKKSPSFNATTATGIGYSKMAFCIACLSEFIRYLGYNAIPMGNDTALSIPLAIDAGLGELGRNGLLITPEYGPCVRLCKVFTDLPLKADKPVEFGVTDFCKGCMKCAEACEVNAIQQEQEPSFRIEGPSNNRGICRWAVNHDLCYSFWIENGGDCSNCISVCPFLEYGNGTK